MHPLFDGPSFDQIEQTVEDWRRRSTRARPRPGLAGLDQHPLEGRPGRRRPSLAANPATRLPADTLIASVCPGLVDTRASRPWFDDFSQARTPAEAAEPIVDLVLADLDPSQYGELIRDGKVLPWRGAAA